MATSKIAARNYLFQVAVGATPTWNSIAGLKSFSHNPGDHDSHTESTDFDSQGQYEEIVLQRGGSLKLEGLRRIDKVTGLADPGQAALDALAQGLVDASIGQIRFRHQSETQWRVWNCTAKSAELGGDTNALGKWGMELTRTGAETYMAAP
ncbi:phage tail tube protein [Kitasatospora sp. NPDC058243]|uniref:phage tail tube protein n=1 Tax=Kitasatospora sp. NPDC058243 TaxID=3346397 RepID=UPI0036DDCA64